MRFIEDLCPPALLYLVFLVIQLGLDAANGMLVTFAIKAIFGVAVVVFLDLLCGMGLGVASWFLVAIPFIVTALGTSIALGIRLDDMFLRETFVDPKARPGDVPAASNGL
jgi:cytosine/uracil/thiamine/allantoin permease